MKTTVSFKDTVMGFTTESILAVLANPIIGLDPAMRSENANVRDILRRELRARGVKEIDIPEEPDSGNPYTLARDAVLEQLALENAKVMQERKKKKKQEMQEPARLRMSFHFDKNQLEVVNQAISLANTELGLDKEQAMELFCADWIASHNTK